MSTEIQKKPVDKVKDALDNETVARAIQSSLPRTMTWDRFKGVVSLAVAKQPKLADDLASLLIACRQCAVDGLSPDGREAALVPYKGKAQYQPMVWGLVKLARQTGEISTISARVVYESDTFDYELGDAERITHKPDMDAEERGRPVAAYAIAIMRDGGKEREVMTRGQIGGIMRRSKSADLDANGNPTAGPWASDPDEMAKKTVLRNLLKRLPRSSELETALARGDELATADAKDITIANALMTLPGATPVKANERATMLMERAKSQPVIDERPAVSRPVVEQTARPLPVEAPTGKTSAQVDRELADEIGEAP